MPDTTDDPELLRRYAEGRSEAAFAELVRRHLGFVYAVALRRSAGDTQVAEAATLQVFTWLAREALTLEGQPLLSGWLYGRTRTASEAALRADRRRHRRETPTGAATDAGAMEWSRIGPVVDEALEQLSELDREALLLRVIRQRAWDEVGASLSLTETAVRMRVERSVGRLQAALADRGVALTPAALEQFLARGGTHPAPPGLFAQITNGALEAAAAAVARSRSATPAGGVRWLVGGSIAVAVLAVAVAVREAGGERRARQELASAQRQTEALAAEARTLRERLQAETRRTQAADEDNARLLEAVTTIAASVAPADTTADAITPEAVTARFRRAGDLARAGRMAEALQEYLWCYDEGMTRFAAFHGVRSTVMPRALAELGRNYSPALQALRERRDRAEQRMLANATDREAALDLAELNDALGEGARTLEEFERLAPDDPRRATLGSRLKDTLIQQRRYAEAAHARPFGQMSAEFEAISTGVGTAGAAMPAAAQQEIHDSLIRSTAADIEVLAGAGDLVHARALAARLLAYDDTDATRQTLQQRLMRAGQPELLSGLAKR